MTEPRIVLARDTGRISLPELGVETGPRTLCVRHKRMSAPALHPEAFHMEWGEFRADPRRAMAGMDALVVVGLSRIMTPSNRTAEVFEITHNLSRGWRKISVDRTLFRSEPWRAWFHWGFVGAPYAEYTYSYLAESHWRAAQEGSRADPFGLAELARWGAGVVVSTAPSLIESAQVEIVPVDPSVHTAYSEEKAAAFDEERTLPAILKRLSAVASAACSRRRIPPRARVLDGPRVEIVRTDLPVDGFLVDRLSSVIDLTNGAYRAFHAGCHAG